MGLNAEASAALLFLILYAILFLLMLFGYATRRLPFFSRHTFVFLHIAIRLASQATGLAFGVVGYSQVNLLVAYFILGAEGYFSLVLCTYRYLISWQVHNYDSHVSWLEPPWPPGTHVAWKFLESFILFGPKRRPMAIIHNLLIAANSLIIVGGSKITGDAKTAQEFNSKLTSAKAMRATGQSIFLSMNVFLLYCICDAMNECRHGHMRKVHPTLKILLGAWTVLLVRGIYGVLSAVIPAFNYFTASNFDEDGLTDAFVTSEYILGTSTEWIACALLLSTYFTSRQDSKQDGVEKSTMKKGITANGC